MDDASRDGTVALAKRLGLHTFVHDRNRGYGGNQKSCYREALALGADVVVMLHPDYQYSPRLLPALADMVASDEYDLALGSRILGRGAIKGGMPRYKYVANRGLTFLQNLMVGQKLSEYHTGYRAFAQVLTTLPWTATRRLRSTIRLLCQAIWAGFTSGDLDPHRYSTRRPPSVFRPCATAGVLGTSAALLACRLGRGSPPFPPELRGTAAASRF